MEETEENGKKRSEEKRAKEAKEQGTKTRERRWRERVGLRGRSSASWNARGRRTGG